MIIIQFALTLQFFFLLKYGRNENLAGQASRHKFDFYTQYNQFYLYDKNSPFHTDDSDFWSKGAFNDMLAVGEGIIGVGTESYGQIKGELFILKAENKKIDYSQYDHIVEGGLELRSGILQVLDCPNSHVEMEIRLKPGTYRVRVYSSGLEGYPSDENEGKDRYIIEIWPGSMIERKVLKHYVRK